MPDLIVVNTGPIIAFTRADALDILVRLPLEFICPPQVEDEIKTGAALGRPFRWPEALRVIALSNPLDPMARAILDTGEAAVIQLALEQGIEWVCMDDRKGRRAALAVGLKVVGSLGLLVMAKKLGIVPEIRPIIDRLMSEGQWYHGDLLQQVLRAVGE